MFRSDRDALAQEVEDLRAEQDRLRGENDAMRREILVRRRHAPSVGVGANVYKAGLGHLSEGERAALTHHTLRAFPTWAAVLLHFVTFGLFPFIHFNLTHDRLPAAESDDPSAGKAIGFSFIPYFNFYWIVFNFLRLTDRLNLQYRLRGRPDPLSRGFMTFVAVVSVIPYLNILLAWTVLWPIAIIMLQRSVNALAAENVADEAKRAAGMRFEPADIPPARIPLVRDLPGPDPVSQQIAEQAAIEEEAALQDEARRDAWRGRAG
ncbi:MAG: hypothetical protein U0359_14795 [Byssovorax sp.]